MRLMDDEADILRFTIELTPDKIAVACSDKSYALSAIIAELRNAVVLLEQQLDAYRRLH